MRVLGVFCVNVFGSVKTTAAMKMLPVFPCSPSINEKRNCVQNLSKGREKYSYILMGGVQGF